MVTPSPTASPPPCISNMDQVLPLSHLCLFYVTEAWVRLELGSLSSGKADGPEGVFKAAWGLCFPPNCVYFSTGSSIWVDTVEASCILPVPVSTWTERLQISGPYTAHHEILPHLGAFGADVRVMFFDFSAFNTIQLNMLKNKHTDTGLYSSVSWITD